MDPERSRGEKNPRGQTTTRKKVTPSNRGLDFMGKGESHKAGTSLRYHGWERGTGP